MNYAKQYELLIAKHGSTSKPDTYSERHHVVPRCLGGLDDPSNLVYLSAEAHYVAHQLLVKMYPAHEGLSWAAIQMTGVGKTTRNNKLYGWLKVRYSDRMKVKWKDPDYYWNRAGVRQYWSDNNPGKREDVRAKLVEGLKNAREHTPDKFKMKDHVKKMHSERMTKSNPMDNPVYRAKLAEIAKKRFSGTGNPSYGKRWVHNGVKNTYLDKNAVLPEGWTEGWIKRVS